jgi:18S rRNA (guanine1575-N7)-methyltransferase
MPNERPEHTGPPENYYNDTEAKKYTSNTHIIEIQQKLSERALELLALPDDQASLVLDIGCGSGLSGEVLSDNGNYWIGVDISKSMLDVAVDRECEGDLILSDIGHGMPFLPGTFDGAISISAIQWLCNADKSSYNPVKRLYHLFCTLYSALKRGSKAVFQLYPETNQQLELITQQAMRAGFTGGVVIDFPNSTKAKKIFLCLFAGGSYQALPKAKVENEMEVKNTNRRSKRTTNDNPKNSKAWVLAKKERHRKQGKEVRPDTKYTGRKRPHSF